MPIAIASKPKVLFISESSGSPSHDQQIRDVADVHWIEGRSYEESIPLIADAVRDHGPFVAFGVSFHNIAAVVNLRATAWSVSGGRY